MQTTSRIIRKSNERGHANHGWLDSYHTFSFADYHDPAWNGFGPIRVINEDWISPTMGFPTHPHRDMEIMTYIIEGELRHEDSMGHKGHLRAGDFQRMSAGTGVLHSEFNGSPETTLHLYQIWVHPRNRGNTPRYDERKDAPSAPMTLLASPEGRAGSFPVDQDMELSLVDFSDQQSHSLEFAPGRGIWLQIISGEVDVEGAALTGGDALAGADLGTLKLHGTSAAKSLLFTFAAD